LEAQISFFSASLTNHRSAGISDVFQGPAFCWKRRSFEQCDELWFLAQHWKYFFASLFYVNQSAAFAPTGHERLFEAGWPRNFLQGDPLTLILLVQSNASLEAKLKPL
jgi:hypothetical protein